jgi:hypothetical protein
MNLSVATAFFGFRKYSNAKKNSKILSRYQDLKETARKDALNVINLLNLLVAGAMHVHRQFAPDVADAPTR